VERCPAHKMPRTHFYVCLTSSTFCDRQIREFSSYLACVSLALLHCWSGDPCKACRRSSPGTPSASLPLSAEPRPIGNRSRDLLLSVAGSVSAPPSELRARPHTFPYNCEPMRERAAVASLQQRGLAGMGRPGHVIEGTVGRVYPHLLPTRPLQVFGKCSSASPCEP
jgi:hypothetical protein